MKRILLAAAAVVLLPAAAQASPCITCSYVSYYHATYGGPNSLQHQINRSGLEIQDVDVEGPDRFDEEGDADTVGGAFTYWDGGGDSGERYEGRYQKAWRPFEGHRTRLVVDTPINVMTFEPMGGDRVASVFGSVSIGAEIPVNPNWSLTPRFAYGVQGGSDFFGNGELVSTSITSRYRINNVGRGEIIIGNMIGYTATVNTGIVDQPFFQLDGGPSENWNFRNGIAYQFPLKSRMFGRQTSLRFSYVNTHLTGDPVMENDINELAASLGVRMRETEVRNKFEALRLGVLYTFTTDGYNAGSLTLGYRF